MSSEKLRKAKIEKNDEFYTRLETVVEELQYYEKELKDKVVLCNCNDKGKAFEEYFKNDENIKELIVTEGRFQDNIEALKRADIVVTNPPFSILNEFINLLIKYKKDFIIIIPLTALGNNNIFKLIKEGKVETGYTNTSSFFSKDRKIISSPCCWLQNVKFGEKKKNERKKEIEYKNIDGANILNIDKIEDIPENYTGKMAVPITFLKSYNGDTKKEFEILEINKKVFVDKKRLFSRVIIKRKETEEKNKPEEIKIDWQERERYFYGEANGKKYIFLKTYKEEKENEE